MWLYATPFLTINCNLAEKDMVIKEINLNERIVQQLISFSEDWEKENSCHGYRKNNLSDIEDKRVFLAMEGIEIYGYLFGHNEIAEKDTSVYKAGAKCFEIDELYVKPQFRNCGIGKELFRYVEKEVSCEVDIIKLNTATKNFSAILHFYINELGMEFWSATLFKKIK